MLYLKWSKILISLKYLCKIIVRRIREKGEFMVKELVIFGELWFWRFCKNYMVLMLCFYRFEVIKKVIEIWYLFMLVKV